MLGSLMRGAKDTAIAMALKSMVNDKLGMYGEITDCSIDTQKSNLTAQALLRGEREKVSVKLDRYEIERDGAEHYIVLKTFTSSREWLTVALNRFLSGKRFKLPAAVTKLL